MIRTIGQISDGRAELIDHATHAFGLSSLETTLVATLLALMLDRDGRPISVGELSKLAPAPNGSVVAALGPHETLVACAIVSVDGTGPILGRSIAVHDEFWPRLTGVPILGVMRPSRETVPLSALVLSQQVLERVQRAASWLRTAHGSWPTLVIQGPRSSGRGALGEALAAELGTGVFPCDGAKLTLDSLATWRRELAWHQAVPVIADADLAAPAALEALSHRFAGPLIVTSATPIVAQMLAAGRAVHVVEVESLSAADRTAIWNRKLSDVGTDASLDTAFLGRRFALGPARISSAVTSLTASKTAITTAVASDLCRAIPELHVGGLATKLSTAGWKDLVVPRAVRTELELIVTWGQGDVPGLDSRAGLACLFHGASGTGKTLAAQVIAGELGRDLFRADLSQILDRYIGESEKRLDQLFREAAAAGAVLFFDEADALFAQRTAIHDARDRYANVETSFLLQRLEQHAGLTILATNLKANLDTAFQRRLAIAIEFLPPEINERHYLWRKFLLQTCTRIEALDLDRLALVSPMTGGDIKNAVFGAALIAKSRGEDLGMQHLALGLWRELKKAGRLVDTSVLGPWHGAVLDFIRAQR
jgi:hypothetical protein